MYMQFIFFIAHLKNSASVSDFGDRVTHNQDHRSRIKSLCQIETFFFVGFLSCPCSEMDSNCTSNARNYMCVSIIVKAYNGETQEIITDDANLFLSEREFEAYRAGPYTAPVSQIFISCAGG